MATQVEQAVAWAKKKLGVTMYKGKCQAFVADCYAYGAGMTRRSASSAKVARNLWRVSTSQSNIPVGAAVYFDSPTSPQYGHVGLHIGNNQVIHAFGTVKQMSVSAIIGCGYAWQGWGWNGGVKPTGAGTTVPAGTSDGGTENASQGESVIHIPQTEKVYTVYEQDTPYKLPDVYAYQWQSYEKKTVLDISDRVGSPSLSDDSDSVCLELTFQVLQATGEKYFKPLEIRPGDYVSVVNTNSKECVFTGQVQAVSGSYRESLSVTCHDNGRLLTTNDVIIQFDNVAAKTAIAQLAAKVGIPSLSCPVLISSVYSLEKNNAATIVQDILETVTAENGVTYFPRMMGNTLVIRSYGDTCVRGFCRQEENLAPFDVMTECDAPQVGWDINDLKNEIVVYSESDNSATVQARAEDAAAVRRYGRRVGLVTFSDQDTVTASAKAQNTLREKSVVKETFSLTTYGSDRIVAGVRMKVDLAEIRGEFWVTAVTHDLGPPHRMTLTMRRAE